MVSYVLATSKTKPRGEKTINKATMLRLLKWKTAVSEGNFGCSLVLQATGCVAATPPARFLSRALALMRERDREVNRD